MARAQLTFDEYRQARLASLAFADGFAHGSDPERAPRRDVRGASASLHWRRGFEAGQRAAASAECSYREVQLGARRPAVTP